MTNRLALTLVLGAGLAAGGTALAGAQSAAPATPATTLHYTIPVKKLAMKFIDRKPKGPSAGDRDFDWSNVYAPGTTTRRGTLMQACDLATLGKRVISDCEGGIANHRGHLTFAFAGVQGGGVATYAITGGTGAYATARGTITFDARGKTIRVTANVAP